MFHVTRRKRARRLLVGPIPLLLSTAAGGTPPIAPFTFIDAIVPSDTSALLTISSGPPGATTYWYVTEGGEPDLEDLLDGTGAVAFGNFEAGQEVVEATGLDPETAYNVFAVTKRGDDYSDIVSDDFTTDAEAPAVTASVEATATGGSTAQIDITATVGATVYYYLSTSGTPPSLEDLKDGTGAAHGYAGSYLQTEGPVAFAGPTGLDPEIEYHIHVVASLGGVDSDIASDSFETEAVDMTAPVLSDPDVTILDETSAELRWETTEQRGLSRVIVSTDDTEPSIAQMIAGLDGNSDPAVWAAGGGSGQAVSASTEQSAIATGLSEVEHYAWVVQHDPSLNVSNVLSLGAFTPADVTAPVVTSPEAAVSGSYAATVQFNSDEAGTGHIVFTISDTTPTDDEIIAGEDHTGTPVKAGEHRSGLSVTAAHNTTTGGDLDGGVMGYRAHIVVVDGAGNKSIPITSSNAFNTAAAAAPGAFVAGNWDLDVGDGDEELDVTINALPARNGADITDIEYRIDGGSWVSSGGIVSFTIDSGLTGGVEADIEIRAANSEGAGAASDIKSETPADGSSWSPSALFASSELGGYFDVTDISTLWQDTAGTTPVTTAGQFVKRVDDLSGNENHWIEATNPPTYRIDGSGNGYLEFDGENDILGCPTIDLEPGSEWQFAVSYAPTATNAVAIWHEATGNPWLFLMQSGSSSTDHDGSGASYRGAYFDNVSFSGNRGAAYTAAQSSSRLLVTGTAGVTFNPKFGYYSATYPGPLGDIYGWVVRQGVMSSTQRDNLDGWLEGLQE